MPHRPRPMLVLIGGKLSSRRQCAGRIQYDKTSFPCTHPATVRGRDGRWRCGGHAKENEFILVAASAFADTLKARADEVQSD